MSEIYSARDIQAFHTTLKVRCEESEPENSRFDYHVPQRLRSFRFTYEADGKINFNYIYL